MHNLAAEASLKPKYCSLMFRQPSVTTTAHIVTTVKTPKTASTYGHQLTAVPAKSKKSKLISHAKDESNIS